MASTGLMVVWFLVIVALIPVTLWLLKRSGLANGVMGQMQSPVKQIGSHNLGQGQRIVTIEVGEGDARKWLVLGVTAHQINTLHTMSPLASEVADGDQRPTTPLNFAALLRSKLGQNQERS